MRSEAAITARPGASPQGHAPPSYADNATARNVRQIAQIQAADHAHSTTGEHIAAAISRFCGSVWFVWIHIAWFAAWLGWNGVSLTAHPFDPPPFQALTLIVSLEAIFLSAFILISQNRETRVAERRNHLDLQINLLAEQEATQTLRLLRQICERLDIALDEPELSHLAEEVDPAALVDMIQQDIEGD